MIVGDLKALAEEICKDKDFASYGFDPEKLHAVLVDATEAHELGVRMWAEREVRAMSLARLNKVKLAADRLNKLWDGLDEADRHAVLTFVDPGRIRADVVSERLTYVADLLEEFDKHYRRERGNQGAARVGNGADLRPLDEFVAPLMVFWETETGRVFGQAIRSADEFGAGVREALSPAMGFLDHAASCLGEGYSIESLETIVRKIKERG